MSTRKVIEDPLTYYDFSMFESVHGQRGLNPSEGYHWGKDLVSWFFFALNWTVPDLVIIFFKIFSNIFVNRGFPKGIRPYILDPFLCNCLS